MASKFICRCGETVRTNLFSGHGVHLLLDEELVDTASGGGPSDLEPLLNEIVKQSEIVAKCGKCGYIAIIDKDYNIKLYEPISGS